MGMNYLIHFVSYRNVVYTPLPPPSASWYSVFHLHNAISGPHTCPRSARGRGGGGGGSGWHKSCPDGKVWRYDTCLGGEA